MIEVNCQHCNGSGVHTCLDCKAHDNVCQVCGGTGIGYEPENNNYDSCPHCASGTTADDHICQECGGTGILPR
jgi:DnaJ-class molecular chaperone